MHINACLLKNTAYDIRLIDHIEHAYESFCNLVELRTNSHSSQ